MLPLTIRTADVPDFDERDLRQVHSWRDLKGLVRAYGYVGTKSSWVRCPGTIAFRFDKTGNVEALPESSISRSSILDLFRRSIEPIVLQALGWETLHASAVVLAAGLIGFCGERTSGKSTLAYAFSRRRYRQHADDTLVLRVRGRDIRALSLPFGVRLRSEATSFFECDGAPSPKASLSPQGNAAPSMIPLSVLFVLRRVATGRPAADLLSPSAAFTALLSHAHCFNPVDADSRQRLVRNYFDIVSGVPVYELQFSPGLDQLDAVLDCVERTTGHVLAASEA